MIKEKLENLINSFTTGGFAAFSTNALGLIITNGEEILFVISSIFSIVLSFYKSIKEMSAKEKESEREFELRKLELETRLKEANTIE